GKTRSPRQPSPFPRAPPLPQRPVHHALSRLSPVAAALPGAESTAGDRRTTQYLALSPHEHGPSDDRLAYRHGGQYREGLPGIGPGTPSHLPGDSSTHQLPDRTEKTTGTGPGDGKTTGLRRSLKRNHPFLIFYCL